VRHLTATICLTIAVLLGSAGVSWSAGFQKGVAAYESGDYATALREWNPLAEQGHANAQFYLGQMYRNGHGVRQSHKTAAKWYRLAADQGNIWAQVNLGVMHQSGLGVSQNNEVAVKWWQHAAERGHDGAQSLIEICKGVYHPQDDSDNGYHNKYVFEWYAGLWCGLYSKELPAPTHHAPLDVKIGISYTKFAKQLIDKGWQPLFGDARFRWESGHKESK